MIFNDLYNLLIFNELYLLKTFFIDNQPLTSLNPKYLLKYLEYSCLFSSFTM